MGTVARFNDLRSGRCRRAASSPDPPPSPPSNRHGGVVPSTRSTELSLRTRNTRASRGMSTA